MTNWRDIHKDFAKKPSWSNKTYQQIWEIYGITYQEAQEWIRVGFEPDDYNEVNQWKDKNFKPSVAKKWIATGFFNLNETEKAKQWKDQGFTPEQTKILKIIEKNKEKFLYEWFEFKKREQN